MRLPRLVCVLVLILTFTVSCSPPTVDSPDLMVRFMDVGQGDAILIDLGDIEILIDGGEKSPGVVSFLSAYVDGDLEVMVATHTDADHIGGLTAVLEQYQVNDIRVNGYTATSKTFTNFMAAANAEGAVVAEAALGDTITAGPLTFRVLNPPDNLFKDANNNSIVLALSYGEVDFIFTGDAETEAEEAMLFQSIAQLPDVEILKLGHHGSRTASSAAFLDLVKPETAVYMCGLDNKYGHPHPETMAALNARGITVYGTETCGTITITTDGKTYSVGMER